MKLNKIKLNEDILSDDIKKYYEKWSNIDSKYTLENTEILLKAHNKLIDNFQKYKPNITLFLKKYDGKYKLSNIIDLKKTNPELLTDLFKELFNIRLINTNDNDIFLNDNFKANSEKIKGSKKMWEDSNAIIKDGDFRVYDVSSQKIAIRMGYYYQYIFKKIQENKILNNQEPLKNPWSFTLRNVGNEYSPEIEKRPLFYNGANQYKFYRNNIAKPNAYKLYFVIDESIDIFDEKMGKYYMSTILITDDNKIKLISLYNNDENFITWINLIKIYPKLEKYREKLIFTPYEEKENDADIKTTVIDTIYEINPDGSEDGPNIFWRQNYDTKKDYIEKGGTISKKKSWLSLNDDLKELYIDTIDENNLLNKIPTKELLDSIISSNSYKIRLNKKLKEINKYEMSYITKNFFKLTYNIAYHSILNENIKIVKTNSTPEQYGIFDTDKEIFIKNNNVFYNIGFIKTKVFFIFEKNDSTTKKYNTIEFTKNDIKFYALNPEISKPNVYILSEKSFLNLINNENIKSVINTNNISDKLKNLQNIPINENKKRGR